MQSGFLRRARRVHPSEENGTIDVQKKSALPENTGLRRVAQLRFLGKLNAAGVTATDVMTTLQTSAVPEAPCGRSDEERGNKSGSTRAALVLKFLRPRKCANSSGSSAEICCICQEECKDGEEEAVLRCRHKFHSGCAARWLAQRNVCPICKKRALSLV